MSDQITSAAFIVIHSLLKKKTESKNRKRRRFWETPVLQSRKIYSGTQLLADFTLQDTGHFKNFCRMSSEDFEVLINLIGHKIVKKDTNYRNAIPVKERLSVTLRYLATGDSYTSLMYLFKISKQCISLIVPEVCQAIIEVLHDYVKVCFILIQILIKSVI